MKGCRKGRGLAYGMVPLPDVTFIPTEQRRAPPRARPKILKSSPCREPLSPWPICPLGPLPAPLLQTLPSSPNASSAPRPQPPGLMGGPGEFRTSGLGSCGPQFLPPRLLSPSLAGGLGRNMGRPVQQPHAPACPRHARRLLGPPFLGGLGRGSLFLGPGLPALPAELILLVDAGRATGQQPLPGRCP